MSLLRPGLAALCLLLGACGAKTGLLIPGCEDEGGLECCEAEPEVCNGRDDDCDGIADDGLACFFLDGEPIEAQTTDRCAEAWYGYGDPDLESANPMPDIRVSDGVVVAVQHGPGCAGASLAVIADLPMDGSGGELNADFTIDPPSAGGLLVIDDDRIPDRREPECSYAAGTGRCDWFWQTCCTDGMLLGTFASDTCVTLTLDGAVGVSAPQVLDGESRIEREYGVPFEICAQFRPAAP